MLSLKSITLIIIVLLSMLTAGLVYQTGWREEKVLVSVNPWREIEVTSWHLPALMLQTYGDAIYTGSNTVWYVENAASQNCYLAHKQDVDAFFDLGDQIIQKYDSMFGAQYSGKMTVIVTAGNNPSDNANCLDGGGSSGGTTITVGISNFWQGDHSMGYIILAHEAMNNWYGNVVGGGWPCDWWADGASPFPYLMASLALIDMHYQVNLPNAVSSAVAGQRHLDGKISDPLVYGFFFQHVYQQLGGDRVEIFARLFGYMRADGFNPNLLNSEWNAPNTYGAYKTAYILAYLSGVASPGNFINQGPAARSAGIGTAQQLSPSPCKADGYYPAYPVDDSIIAAIWQKRMALQSVPKSDPQWQAFLNGDYRNSNEKALIVKACLAPADIGCSDIGASVKVTYVDTNGIAQTITVTTPQTIQVKASSQYTVDFQSKTGYAFSYWNKWGAISGLANPFVGPADNDWSLIANLTPIVPPVTIHTNLFIIQKSGQAMSIVNGQTVKWPVSAPVAFQVQVTQAPSVSIYGVRAIVDGAQYSMPQSGSWTYTSTWITLSAGSHTIRFEYQPSSGGSWGSLGLLSTQSQDTGLANMLDNTPIVVGLVAVLVTISLAVFWKRRS